MKSIKKIVLITAPLFSMLLHSCLNYDTPKREAPITIYINEESFEEGYVGSFPINNIPEFDYTVDTNITVDHSFTFLKDSVEIGDSLPPEVGNYGYRVTVFENDVFKYTRKEITFSLIDSRDIPTMRTYLSIDGGDPQEITSDNAGNIQEGSSYTFSAELEPNTLEYSIEYRSATTKYGSTAPTDPGDYYVVITSKENHEYKSINRTINYSIVASVTPPITGATEINVFAINDFHGAIESSGSNPGAAKLFSFLKNKKSTQNSLLLDQGDTWQGSIYSNHNRGAMITDIMNYVKFDARTIGNHDFDWGTEALITNSNRSYDGYTTPTLAANVYDYDFDTKTTGTIQQSQIGVKSVTKVLNYGIKVGIVGVIGDEQITSINTLAVKNIAFTSHINAIKEEATNLRNNGCQVVIVSAHAPEGQLQGSGLSSYVDLVLCGHSHAPHEISNEGDLYYAQFGSYGQEVGEINFTYDFARHEITNTEITTYVKNDISAVSTNSTIQSIIDTYSAECSAEANVVLAKRVNGNFYARGQLANMMANAMLDKAVSEGYIDIDLAMLNNARVTLYSNYAPFKYSHIYEAFPFDNEIYIANVKGSELKKELITYTNYFCRSTKFTDDYFVDNKTYKIAIIDYLFFHTNEHRYYDYFSITAGEYIGKLSMNYRHILREWLLNSGYANGSKTLNSRDFETNGSNPQFKSFTA